MSSIDIGLLFDHDRFPSGLFLLPVLIYFPFGLILAVLRFFIGAQAFLLACLASKANHLRRVVLRIMCTVLGIIVTHEGTQNHTAETTVMVSNYTSTLDHLAVDLVLPSILPSVWDLPSALMWSLGYRDMGAKKGRDTLIQNAKKHCQESQIPLLVFPEGASTNGKTGLLKFSIWPFSLEQSVQPLIISVSRPLFVHIAPSVLGGRWWVDIFWFLFVPYTRFHIKVLPLMRLDDSETVEEFTQRVQTHMANAMGIQPTLHTSADKVEYAKRKLFIAPNESTQMSPSRHGGFRSDDNDPIVTMAHQVKEVLPHVPLDIIRKDLTMTKDVDLTITNVLEGRVQYTPEEPGTEADRSPSLSPPEKPSTSAKQFGKSTRDRHKSFEERKQVLLESARRKYMEKHGML